MKLNVNRSDFTGNLAADLQSGLITAFDDADNLLTADDAINKLADGAKVVGVCAANDEAAQRVYDGVRRIRTFKIQLNDAAPESKRQISSYEKHKQRIHDAWKGEQPKQSNDSQSAYEKHKQRIHDAWKGEGSN